MEARAKIAAHLRRVRPHVVITFGPEGAYGHPDHIAISQLTTSAIVCAADPSFVTAPPGGRPHRVSKLLFISWSSKKWSAYQTALRKLVSRVDGQERQASPVARLGDYHCARHERGLVHGLARGVVPQDADDDLQEARGTAGRTPAVALGNAGVLPCLQHREWRPHAGIGFVRGTQMRTAPEIEALWRRRAPLEMDAAEFREIAHRLVDDIADRLARIPDGPVTPDDSPAELRQLVGQTDSPWAAPIPLKS